MGLFGRGKAEQDAEAKKSRFQEALAQIEPLDIDAEFPSATSDQAETMEQMWVTVVSNVGNAGRFDPSQIAAISTLGGRLVADNPSLSGFVDRLRDIAQNECARRPSDPSWNALARHL